jgi:hypothetical protein
MYDSNCFHQPKIEIHSTDQVYGKHLIYFIFTVPKTENDYLTIYEGG